MELYREYPAWLIFLRRTYAVAAGVLALPFMLFWKDRARFYSYLHRVWSKTSDKPVWMDQAEKATGDFYMYPVLFANNTHRCPHSDTISTWLYYLRQETRKK